MASAHPSARRATRQGEFDPMRKFVRVRELRKDGFVEFDFAIGEPEIYVEMILHADAFDDFCADNQVEFLTDEPAAEDEQQWRLSQTSGRQFK
ncbi:phenol hydroxylase subunit [Nitrogeniibacter aestuarii]|uniref:phenol hydroxylase subunit n=1 Tax=Nitrogeniibacter aestuarii TaxID=2815343 RepID=UPI001D0FBD96|nr:phenol hydroxylase subunit [Nitrogeniibacter aestuarii]